MSLIDRFVSRLRAKPPVITSAHGETTEWARRQAAENMAMDAAVRFRVEQLLIKEMGSEEAGMAEARRRYPEAYRRLS